MQVKMDLNQEKHNTSKSHSTIEPQISFKKNWVIPCLIELTCNVINTGTVRHIFECSSGGVASLAS